MRSMTYAEIVELAKTSLDDAIKEAKINMKNDPSEGAWAGLYLELVERREAT